MKKIKIRNEKLLFTVLIIALFIIFLLYYSLVFSVTFARNSFTNQMVDISDNNENSIFKIKKVSLYSNANAIDNSENNSLKNMNICQFTDIQIYIDNTSYISELKDENTVKDLYIDNIQINTNSQNAGTQSLNYKNPLDFGKYKKIKDPENNSINFNIVSTNESNESADYSKPTFYTDCSNPITLGYMNKDILTNYAVSQDANSNTISFNGKVLKEANINLNDISYVLNFKIHITNNLNQKFVYDMKLNVDLTENNNAIYNGFASSTKTTTGNEYNFFKEF